MFTACSPLSEVITISKLSYLNILFFESAVVGYYCPWMKDKRVALRSFLCPIFILSLSPHTPEGNNVAL